MVRNERKPGHPPGMTRRVMRGFNAAEFAQIRQQRGYSVADLARLSSVGLATLHHWEAERVTPQIDRLVRVMAILETPIEEVIDLAPHERYPGDWRVIRGLTQPELAAAAGIATTTLRAIERADVALTDTNAQALGHALDISPAAYRAAYERARTRPPGTTA